MNKETQQKMVDISAKITPGQRRWLDQEALRRSTPGNMGSISEVLRSLIEYYRAHQSNETRDESK